MSEKLKYIVSELNKPPFNKNYNLISFDSLSPDDLLQVLSDVLTEIEASSKIDIKSEEPEETTIRLLSSLRVLKYDPGSDVVGFRQGVVNGDKHTIQPILEWLFKNFQEVKKRAYLAKYLVKVEVPVEILGDADVAALYEQYEALIEEFKSVHKEVTNLKGRSDHAAELRADIEAMEREKEIVLSKIQRMSRKLEKVENKEAYLEAARRLRIEKERERELGGQRHRELELVQELGEKYGMLTRELGEVRQASHHLTPQDLVRKVEEEIQMTEYIANEKLPGEVTHLQKEVEMMTRVAQAPNPTQEAIEGLRTQIEELRGKISEEMEKRVEDRSGSEERLGPFRQQAAIISRRKEEVAGRYTEVKAKYDLLQHQIQAREKEGERVLSEKEYKEFVSKLKVRSTVYKAKRAQMASLVAETGVQARTLDILKHRLEALPDPESIEGVADEVKEGIPKEELLQEVNSLTAKIAAQKASLLPKVQELRKRREEYNELLDVHTEKKKAYDAKAAVLESSIAKLEQEVKELMKKDISDRSEIAQLAARSVIMSALLERAHSEEAVAKARDKLSGRISEWEKESERLKEVQREVKESQAKESRQRHLWKGLHELLECKKQCMEEEKQREGIVRKTKMAETLILE